jgi:hypothetical protein
MLIQIPGVQAPAVTHALVVGVSHYPFADGPEQTADGEAFGITNLTGAAKSASDIAAWLLDEYRNPDAPLASVRVLLSPTDGEELNPRVARELTQPAPATRDAVVTEFDEFRQACRENPDNVAFVYFAGHGIQLNKRGAVVLLHDFGVMGKGNKLYGAIDVAGCRDAMDESGNAHRQIWFSDACRQLPDIARKFESLAGGPFKADEGIGQVDASPLFLASSARESAFAAVGETTIFSDALLASLRGDAATMPTPDCSDWHISTTTLIRTLQGKVDAILAGREEQTIDITGRVREMVAHRFENPPDVDIVVNLLPADATPVPMPRLWLDDKDQGIDPSWPVRFRGDAGIYLLTVTVAPPLTTNVNKPFLASPPGYQNEVSVS